MDSSTISAVELFEQDEKKDLLRFVTAGSVDDGKSTLIGQLLYESKGIYEDQLEAVRNASGKKGSTQEGLDLALVTDGLKAEREQGITIDVAYRYFSTPKRKFIIADSPGHEQYTRNMATGASTANLAVILIDASQGVTTQSKRHAFITSLLRIPHFIITVNKMDLVDYSEDVYNRIVEEFSEFTTKLEMSDLTFIPISALKGDNVVDRSENMPWYGGRALLDHLETIHIASDRNMIDLRLPIQYVSRPNPNFRGFMGTPASGIIRPNDEIMALPSGMTSRVTQVLGPDGPMPEGFSPVPITVTLEDEIDISRGDTIVHVNNLPHVDRMFEAMVVWMAEESMSIDKQYIIKHATRKTPCVISNIRYRIDVNTTHRHDADVLRLNEIGRCVIELARPIAFDSYKKNHSTGSFIIIDRLTNNTVGAGMILDVEPNVLQPEDSHRVTKVRSAHIHRHTSRISADEHTKALGHKPMTIWMTGLTGSGKSEVAYALERKLFDADLTSNVLDSGNTRLGLNKDLNFSADDRAENSRRVAEMAKLFNNTGLIVICAFLSPFRIDRQLARDIVGHDRFVEIYFSAPIDYCREHALENIYDKAESGEIKNYSGVTAPYEVPESPDLVLPRHEISTDECVSKLIDLLKRKAIIS